MITYDISQSLAFIRMGKDVLCGFMTSLGIFRTILKKIMKLGIHSYKKYRLLFPSNECGTILDPYDMQLSLVGRCSLCTLLEDKNDSSAFSYQLCKLQSTAMPLPTKTCSLDAVVVWMIWKSLSLSDCIYSMLHKTEPMPDPMALVKNQWLDNSVSRRRAYSANLR